MQIQEIIDVILSTAVMGSLFFTLLFATKAVKTKESKQEQKGHFLKAGIFLAIYIISNFLRLWAERYFVQ